MATRSGVVVGMPFDRVKALFGAELQSVENFYDDKVTEATIWEADHRHGVRFTVREGLVEQIAAGDSALEWVEGCGV